MKNLVVTEEVEEEYQTVNIIFQTRKIEKNKINWRREEIIEERKPKA